jgi:site-specific DNA-methyltransferase (adenine-specific)
MQAFKLILDGSSMMAYLTMMCARLIELNRILKPTGSIYLHCDINASHYLKLLMDAIFGRENFRNEIEWKRTSSHNDSKKFPHIHDSILFYAREGYTWNPIFSTDINSLWTDIFPLSSRSVEKLDYPTQKPEKLLERIILASSNPTDTVLDPYCGCGTTLAASQRLNRHWIGIDNSPLAIEMTERRLQLAVGELRYA